jgi:hypothetical protein
VEEKEERKKGQDERRVGFHINRSTDGGELKRKQESRGEADTDLIS